MRCSYNLRALETNKEIFQYDKDKLKQRFSNERFVNEVKLIDSQH